MVAAQGGRIEVVKQLLSAGADPNYSRRVPWHWKPAQRITALYAAAMRGREEVVRVLLDAGAHTSIPEASLAWRLAAGPSLRFAQLHAYAYVVA